MNISAALSESPDKKLRQRDWPPGMYIMPVSPTQWELTSSDTDAIRRKSISLKDLETWLWEPYIEKLHGKDIRSCPTCKNFNYVGQDLEAVWGRCAHPEAQEILKTVSIERGCRYWEPKK
jgi:hypothetical protein